MLDFLFIFLNVFLATGVFVAFRLILHFKTVAIQVLFINYLVAAILAFFSLHSPSFCIQFIAQSPNIVPIAIGLGILFVIGYLITSLSTFKVGIGITSAASKMAVVIPVFVGIFLLEQKDDLFFKLAGLVCVLISFAFLFEKGKKSVLKHSDYLLTFLVFIFSGIIDSGIDLTQQFFISSTEERNSFLLMTFAVSTLFSCPFAIKSAFKKEQNFKPITIVLGIIVGFLNFFNSSLMIRNIHEVGSSVFFPVFNSAIVVFGVLAGVLFFKEKLLRRTVFVILFAILGVILLAIAV